MDNEFNPFEWSALDSLKLQRSPKFKPGDEAWIIRRRKPHKTMIHSVNLKVCKDDHGDGYVAIHVGYDAGPYRFREHGPTLEYRPYELYATLEEAQKDCGWHPVEGITDDVWLAALGDRDVEGSVEECELFKCCAAVSHARDYLLECRDDKGMLERDREQLRALLSPRQCDSSPTAVRPNLDLILSKLDITVTDPPSE